MCIRDSMYPTLNSSSYATTRKKKSSKTGQNWPKLFNFGTIMNFSRNSFNKPDKMTCAVLRFKIQRLTIAYNRNTPCIWYVQVRELKLYFYPSAEGFEKKKKKNWNKMTSENLVLPISPSIYGGARIPRAREIWCQNCCAETTTCVCSGTRFWDVFSNKRRKKHLKKKSHHTRQEIDLCWSLSSSLRNSSPY